MQRQSENARRRVLLICEPAGGGVRRHVVDLLGALDTATFDITLLYGSSRMDSAFLAAVPELEKKWRLLPVQSLRRSISLRDIPAFFVICREILRFRPQVVHCHSSKAGVLGRMAAWLLRVPVILYTPHCYSFLLPEASRGTATFYTAIERLFCRYFTTHVIHVSNGERQQGLQAGLGPPERLVVVCNGLPSLEQGHRELARQQLQAGAGEFLVGVAARLDAQKNPHLFFEIALAACKRYEHVRFCWLGDGPLLDELRGKATAAGLAAQIVFYGYREAAPFLTEGFDLYLLTSHCEGLPYGLLEAARAGIPMVATGVTGNDEVVVEDVNGFLFPDGDAAAGAALVLRVLEGDAPSAKDIRDDFVCRFSLARMVAELSALYLGEGRVL